MAVRIARGLLIATVAGLFAFTVAANYGIDLVWSSFRSPIRQAHPLPTRSNITIAVDRDGAIYWNGKRISCLELNARLRARGLKPGSPPRGSIPCGRFPDPGAPQ